MVARPGHEPGHDVPAEGCTWAHYVGLLVAEHGSWARLADLLVRRARGAEGVPEAPDTVEKGLRRLASRGRKSGGQYGRWLVRHFGVPLPLADWARWLGQYHSRFADLPSTLREAQLRLWDAPPLAETPSAAWVDLGLASVALRRRDVPAATALLARAEARTERAGPAAALEAALLRARLAQDAGDAARAEASLAESERLLRSRDLGAADRACYLARLRDQQAYRLLHPTSGQADLARALATYRSIPEGSAQPFVAFRRALGEAYCLWRQGQVREAARQARLASEHAGDGGLLRFRVMALSLLSQIATGAEAETARARASAIARALEDEDLLERIGRRASAP